MVLDCFVLHVLLLYSPAGKFVHLGLACAPVPVHGLPAVREPRGLPCGVGDMALRHCLRHPVDATEVFREQSTHRQVAVPGRAYGAG